MTAGWPLLARATGDEATDAPGIRHAAADALRLQEALTGVVGRLAGPGCPPLLGAALRHAVLGGGNRLRPRLCMAVARACGAPERELTLQAATAIELLHCASLVHDDLPCFDDADLRRGLPSVHRAFGEPLAVLCGDALITGAFAVLGEAVGGEPKKAGLLVRLLARAAGAAGGMAGGQAWECEPVAELGAYHQAKTAALFEAATMAGAASVGMPHEPWRMLGRSIGLAYQLADDVRDVRGDPAALGKPVGRDAARARPNALRLLGPERSRALLHEHCAGAGAAAPDCPGRAELIDFVALLLAQATR